MEIESIEFANSFKTKVTQAAQKILDGDKNNLALDSLWSSFIVSFDDSYNKNLFHVFSGKELGFKNVSKIYVFLKDC